MPQIVTINESVIRGAEPNLLQKKGCLISLGATIMPAGEMRFVSNLSDLNTLVDPSNLAQIQSLSDGKSPAFIRGEADKANSSRVVDPAIVGSVPSYQVPFSHDDVVFVNSSDIVKGANKFEVTSKLSNVIPSLCATETLEFTNLRKSDAAYANGYVEFKSVDSSGIVTLTISLDTPLDADLPANTEFKVNIAGYSILDNRDAVTELLAMGDSWFANSTNGCYVLELGVLKANMIGATFSKWYAENEHLYYGYVFPRNAANDNALVSFVANQSGNNTRVYFFFCGDKDSYSNLIVNSEGHKAAFYGVEYTGSAVASGTTAASLSGEHLAAAVCAQYLSADPSALNRLAPMSFRVLNGITPWPEAKNGANFQKFKTDNVGFAGTANEGGVEGSILFWGNFMNGDTMSGWYGADWCSINMELQLANTIIEGSQPGISPLVYDQSGISRLAARAKQTLDSAVSAGCIVPDYTLSVTPFENYLKNNPSDYTAGIFNGLASTIVPVRGFLSLTYNLAVDFSGQTVIATTK